MKKGGRAGALVVMMAAQPEGKRGPLQCAKQNLPSPPKPSKRQPGYPSLTQGPSPAECLAELLREAEQRGIKPITEEEFDQLMAEPSFWPEDETIDEFLAWRRQSRKEKR